MYFTRHNPNLYRQRSYLARATAVVEMAVVLPLLLTILFGIIEFGWLFMVTHTLTSAAREGCRTAVLSGATDAYITAKVDAFMQPSGFKPGDYQLVITHSNSADPTEIVIVKVPYSKVSLVGGFFGFADFDIQGYAAMRKEGTAPTPNPG